MKKDTIRGLNVLISLFNIVIALILGNYSAAAGWTVAFLGWGVAWSDAHIESENSHQP